MTSFALPGPGDGCVRGEWLAAASLGDLEGRVHGGQPSGAISPFFTDTSMPLLSSKEKSSSVLAYIEAFLNPISGELLAVADDDTLRLTKYLAAAKQLKLMVMLQRQLPAGTASSNIHDRAKTLLDKAMSSLATEFCHLRIWRHDYRRGISISLVSIWESIRRSCSDSSSSNSGSVASWSSSSASLSGGTSGSSGGSLSALFEDMSVRNDKAFRRMDLIDRNVLPTLNDIAGVMIEGGYEEMLRRAIDRYSAQLASYLEVLDINNFLGGHKEESKEILLKVWTTVMHFIVGFLSEMQGQLNGQDLGFFFLRERQDLGYFNIVKEDYFLAITKQSIRKLLRVADSTCIQGAPPIDTAPKPDLSKMVNLVMIYQALNHSIPTILAMLSGQAKESILAECEGLIRRLSGMFVKLCVEQNDLVKERRLDISDIGVHPFTRHVIDHVRMLVQHKSTVCLMLKDDLKAFHQLVVQLISSLESMLDMNSKGFQLPGQQQMFLLNNAHFMLQEAKIEKDLGQILGEGWLTCSLQDMWILHGHLSYLVW